jgi:hypothetical protein
MVINEIEAPSIGACLSSYFYNSINLVRLSTQNVQHSLGASKLCRPVKLSLADSPPAQN